MRRSLLLIAVVAALLLTGCGQGEQEGETASPQPSSVTQRTEEIAQKAAEKTAEVSQALVEKAAQTGRETAEKIEGTTEAAREKAAAMSAAAQDKAGAMAEKAKREVAGAADSVGKSLQEIAARLAPPETVTIDNKNGKVTLPHAAHAKTIECATCHGDREPGPLSLGKEAAHRLCKGCHQERDAGPGRCTGCHQKKRPTAPEGC